MPHLKSLREYVAELGRLGELRLVEQEVDWNLELGAIIRRAYDLRAPAPLFTHVKGAAAGFRVLGAPAALSRQPEMPLCRIALSLGLPVGARAPEIIDALARAVDRPGTPPRIVETGPCKENVLRGAAIDLTRFPVPLIHAGDGGRYINTWGVVIAKSPDGRWTNWCITRVMLHGRDTMVALVAPRQHLGMLHAEWRALGKPMPFAIALGCEPALPFAAAMPLPAEVSECDFLGAYFGEPLELTPAESVDLLVPATAEIVLEGTVSPEERVPEGPMGEYAGYIEPERRSLQPLFRVSAVTHRHDPILPVVVSGEPVEEDHTCWGTGVAAMILSALRRGGFPVASVFSPFESALHWLVVTVDAQGRKAFTREALVDRLAELAFPTKAGRVVSKYILLDDDVDPSRLEEVVWAFATRCHPGRGQRVFENVPVTPLQPYLSAEERKTGMSSKIVHDCLWPDDVPEGARLGRLSLEHGWPADVRKRVLERWRGYGFD